MSGVWYQVQGEPNQVSSRSWHQARSGHWSESLLPRLVMWSLFAVAFQSTPHLAVCREHDLSSHPGLLMYWATNYPLPDPAWGTASQEKKKTGSTYALSTFGSGLHFSCVLNNRTIFLCRKIPTGIKLPYVEEHFILVTYFVFFTILRPVTDSH